MDITYALFKVSMIRDYYVELVGERIAGNIAWSPDTGMALRKWRRKFNASQLEVAKLMGVKPSVITDYEKGRRTPGVKFLRKYVKALVDVDRERGYGIVKELAKSFGINVDYILDLGDFYHEVSYDELVKALGGILVNSFIPEEPIYGYVIVDSIKSITLLSGNEYYQLLSFSVNRALIFTKVTTGRSPMVALKVAPMKPKVVGLHRPVKVDPLSIYLSEVERVPIIVSTLNSEKELVERLRELK